MITAANKSKLSDMISAEAMNATADVMRGFPQVDGDDKVHVGVG